MASTPDRTNNVHSSIILGDIWDSLSTSNCLDLVFLTILCQADWLALLGSLELPRSAIVWIGLTYATSVLGAFSELGHLHD